MSDVTEFAETDPRSFLDDYPEGLGGHVERFDAELGISGWAMNINAPEQILTIEMVVDDQVIAQCKTGIARPDVTAGRAVEASPGFRFAEADISRLGPIACFCLDREVTFRIAGTLHPLVCTGEAPTLARLFPAPSTQNGLPKPADVDLADRLFELQRRASTINAQPQRPIPGQLAGFIEAVALDEGACVWLSGWIRPTGTVDCPATIVSLQTAPAGFAFACFDRADLPAGCFGFIGVLLTSWRPMQGAEVHIYMDGEGKFLHGTPAMRILPFAEFGENVLPLLATAHTGHRHTLQRMLVPPDNWNLSNQNGLHVCASVDEILVLPGFGALVSGWVVSPLREVSEFVLRLGSAILTCDRDSLYYKARPDLAKTFPGNERALQKAGFVAAFRGKMAASDICYPILKLVYEDGSSSNHALDRQAFRRLAEDAGLAAARELFPSLNSELFFEDLAAALRDDLQARNREFWPYVVTRAKQVLVFVVPDDASDMYLLLTSVDQRLRAQSAPPAVAFIGSTSGHRTPLVSLFNALRAGSSVKYSLFWMDDPAYALYCLPAMLAELGAARFAFFAAGIFLTAAGWRAALNSLPQSHPGLHLLEIEDPAAPDRHAELSARAFAWSSLTGALWLRRMPFFLGGFHADNGIGDASDHVRVHRAAAYSARLPSAGKLIASINRLAVAA